MIEPGRASIPSDLLLKEKIIIVRRVRLVWSVRMENLVGFSLLISYLVVTIWDQLALLSYPLICHIVYPDGLDALFGAIKRWSLLL